MNILGLDGLNAPVRLLYFAAVFAGMAWLTFYTVMKSKGLSDFLDALSDERETVGRKAQAFWRVWRGRKPGPW